MSLIRLKLAFDKIIYYSFQILVVLILNAMKVEINCIVLYYTTVSTVVLSCERRLEIVRRFILLSSRSVGD